MQQRTTPTQTHKRLLTYAEREAHRREAVRVNNERKRKQYMAVTPHCDRCGATLLLCECPAYDARAAQYRDVVVTLNVATMKRHIEVI